MSPSQATVGTRVRCVIGFSGVPKGTEGVIDEIYELYASGLGIMVAWDLPESPLPPGYVAHDGRSAIQTGILRDGFSPREFPYLEVIRDD